MFFSQKRENIKDLLQRPTLIGLAMAAAPSSPRRDRITALLVFAETVVSKTDDEKGNRDWKGRPEVLEVITLLASATVLNWDRSFRI